MAQIDRDPLEPMVDRRVEKHQGDAARSLAVTYSLEASLRGELQSTAGPDLQASLSLAATKGLEDAGREAGVAPTDA